ncbi:MAG: hypothetical protein ACI4R8_02585 [Candidatus Caccovivens sp.]
MAEKINMKGLLDRIEIDGDKKELVCVTPDGDITRKDFTEMSLYEAYEAVFGKFPDGGSKNKNLSNKEFIK